MSKLYRVTAYVLDLNNTCPTVEYVVNQIEHNRYPEFIDVTEVLETDVEEWHDDHELNLNNPPYVKYFPDIEAGPLDEYLKAEYRRVRQIMLRLIDENGALKRQAHKDREEFDKLKKVQEFVKAMGDLTK